jgi:hypothetical protein
MKASVLSLRALASVALVSAVALSGCGGGGGSSSSVPAAATSQNLPTLPSGSTPIGALNLLRPAGTTAVNLTSTTPAGHTVDVPDQTTVQMSASASAGGASALAGESQHAFTGSLHGGSAASTRRATSDVAINLPFDLSYHGGVVLGSAVSHNLFVNYPLATRQSLNFAPGTIEAALNNDAFITVLYQYLYGPGTVTSAPVTGNYPKGVGADVTDTYQSPRPGASNQYYGQLQILLAVKAAADALGSSAGSGYGHIYHVFLPQNVDTCFESPLGTPTSSCYSPDKTSTFAFCAYHGSFTYSGTRYLYTVEPYQDVAGCRNNVYNQALPRAVSPTVDPADPGYSTLSHELFETISDPLGNAWWNQFSGGYEMADICAEYDNFVTVNGQSFVLQSEYSDIDHLCVSANLDPNVGPQTPQSVRRAGN